MDGIITGGAITKEEIQLKEIAIATLKDVRFKLQKWKSHIPKLKNESLVSSVDAEQANAKRQLENDTYDNSSHSDQRGIIQKLASIYDPLVIASSVTLYGKIIYREACDLKNGCDKELLNQVVKKYYNCIKRLDAQIKVPRCIGMFK